MEYIKGDWYYEEESGFILCIEEGKDNPTVIAEILVAQANAHLISAAPDLYEACKAIPRILYGLSLDARQALVAQKAIDQCKQALAKAEGK